MPIAKTNKQTVSALTKVTCHATNQLPKFMGGGHTLTSLNFAYCIHVHEYNNSQSKANLFHKPEGVKIKPHSDILAAALTW